MAGKTHKKGDREDENIGTVNFLGLFEFTAKSIPYAQALAGVACIIVAWSIAPTKYSEGEFGPTIASKTPPPTTVDTLKEDKPVIG